MKAFPNVDFHRQKEKEDSHLLLQVNVTHHTMLLQSAVSGPLKETEGEKFQVNKANTRKRHSGFLGLRWLVEEAWIIGQRNVGVTGLLSRVHVQSRGRGVPDSQHKWEEGGWGGVGV